MTRPNFIVVASALISLTSLYSAFKTTGVTRNIALGLSNTTGCIALTASVIGSSKHKEFTREIDRLKSDWSRELTLKSQDLASLKNNFEATAKAKSLLEEQLKSTQNDLEILVVETTELNRLLSVAKREFRNEVEAKDSRLENHLAKFQKYLVNELFEYLSVTLDTLIGDIETKLEDERFTLLHLALKKKHDLLLTATNDFNNRLKSLNDLPPTEYEKLASGLIATVRELADIRVGYRALLNRQTRFTLQEKTQVLEDILTSSVPLESANGKIAEISTQTGELLKELHQCHQQKLEALYQVAYESENAVQELDAIAQSQLSQIDKLQAQVQHLSTKVAELEKPLQFYGSCSIAVAGNSISNFYFKNYGYRLDALTWQENDTGYDLVYATRNNPGLTANELHQGNSREQLAAFTNSLKGTIPEFAFNYQNCTLSLKVTLRHPTKKLNSAEEIDKIWVPASKFESYVRRWERVRITAGSTGGKSPTAKNLALAILRGRNGVGEIKLYDPQHGSKKDFWAMPKTGTSHEDNLAGMQELCELIDQRRHGSNHQFQLYIFDELDNTVTTLKEGAKFKDLIKVSLKEGSHASIGVIYIGQSCDVTEVPGMTHSNWNNAIQLHIGSNAGLFLERLSTIPTDEKTRLLEQYRKIQEYCDHKNEELGLDILTDASAYRFALAVPLTGLPKFLQLPDFDCYDYYDVMSTNTQNLLISNSIESTLQPTKNVEITCTNCGSAEVIKKGKLATGKQQFQCKSCFKKFS